MDFTRFLFRDRETIFAGKWGAKDLYLVIQISVSRHSQIQTPS